VERWQRRITLGINRQMGSGLRIFSQNWGLRPMRCQPSGKLVKDMGSHLQFPRAERIGLHSAIRERIEPSWPPGRMPELALCNEVGEVRAASGIMGRHRKCSVVIIIGAVSCAWKGSIWYT